MCKTKIQIMPEFQHKDMAAGRWQTLTLCEQMGNIGSEVGRAVAAGKRGDIGRRESALDRAFELIDLTAADDRWQGARRREILRSREVLADSMFGQKIYAEPENLEKYFFQFAMAARTGK